jgi:hypothetical protein
MYVGPVALQKLLFASIFASRSSSSDIFPIPSQTIPHSLSDLAMMGMDF